MMGAVPEPWRGVPGFRNRRTFPTADICHGFLYFLLICILLDLNLFPSQIPLYKPILQLSHFSMLPRYFQKVVVEVIQCPQKRRFSEKRFCPADLFGKVGVVGVPFGKGQKKKGKDEVGLQIAPDFIRKTGFVEDLAGVGVDISDFGNVEYKPECGLSETNMHNLDHVAPCARSVSNSVEQVLSGCRSCLVLGGDHSIAVGSIYGHMKVADPRKVALVYVDAHADINTKQTSPSGNMHGMTVALLSQELQTHWGGEGVPGMDWLSPSLCLKNVAYIGTRSVDFGEVNFLRQNNVAVFGIDDIQKFGMEKILCKALTTIDPSNNKSIHVSFDIDALDCLEAPCTTAPVRGGLTLREGIALAEFFHRTGRLSVVDLVEVNAAIGNEIQRNMTLEAAKQILLAMYGYCRKGNQKPIQES